MSFAKASLVSLGLVCAFALGLSLGPKFSENGVVTIEPVVSAAPAAAVDVPVTDPAPVVRATPRLERVPTASAPPVQQHVERLFPSTTAAPTCAKRPRASPMRCS